ncbi:LETM1 domain-containing protein ylh47, partial [Dimargaris xerosporica]
MQGFRQRQTSLAFGPRPVGTPGLVNHGALVVVAGFRIRSLAQSAGRFTHTSSPSQPPLRSLNTDPAPSSAPESSASARKSKNASRGALATEPKQHQPHPTMPQDLKDRIAKATAETATSSVPTTEAKATNPAAAAAKKPLMQRIKDELHHLWDGTKLLALETKISTKLVYRMISGHTLSRREQRQLSRTSKDLLRLIPFSFFIIIPFMELLLPVALWLFPNMLPSTFQTKKSEDDKRRKLLKVRMEVSKFLRETMAESAKERVASAEKQDAEQLVTMFHDIRTTGQLASTSDLLRVARTFEDEFTLDNLSRPQLVSICRYLELSVYGLDNMLRSRIQHKMKMIRADDRLIKSEGVDSLTIPELQTACSVRGMRAVGVSPARLRSELKQWLDLNLDHKVPMTLLILMRAFAISDQDSATLSPDVLQATISSLPDNLLSEAELKVSEAQGTATNKQRLAVLSQQEDLIEDEHEQEQWDEEKRSKAKKPSEPK